MTQKTSTKKLSNHVLLRFPAKALRTKQIIDHADHHGYAGIVCFSCGNSSVHIRIQLRSRANRLTLLDISEHGDLKPNRWFTQGEIARHWPVHFDATSGHLNKALMGRIAEAFRVYLDKHDFRSHGTHWYVPTGSGETLLALQKAYPDMTFQAVYNLDRYTRYEPEAPLNVAVSEICEPIYDPSGIVWTEQNF